MIPQNTIRLIIEAARVEEVIGEFVRLQKRGSNFVGLCPFHDEKTPSFSVSPTKGIYKCFGCGKAGNSVNFIMEHEHYSYPEALRFLAKKFNIIIEEEEPTPEQTEKANELESLYNINGFAQKFFTHTLHETEDGKALALSYLKEREFKPSVIEKFQLGFCLPVWDGFTGYALSQGYKEDILEKSGLTIRKENRMYDRFRGRVMFPIHNLTGRVIGFGGRILTSDTNQPKYVNSPETEIYKKSQVLYGLYFTKGDLIATGNCYLVEGYTDVISLYQAGIRNVVASSGTSLTVEQIRLIKRYASTITILYDGDEAGLKASFRGIDLILEQGMNVKIVMFPDGEDPDSFVRKNRISEVEEYLVKERRDFIEFKTSLLLSGAGNDPVKRAEIIREVIQSIALIPDAITRSVYVKECSAVMQIAEQTLVNELQKKLREKYRKLLQEKSAKEDYVPEFSDPIAEQQIESDHTVSDYQEKEVVRLLIQYGNREIVFEYPEEKELEKQEISVNVAVFIIDDLVADEIVIKNPVYSRIFSVYADYLKTNGSPPGFDFFRDHPDVSISRTAIDISNTAYEISRHWAEDFGIQTPGEEDKLKEAVIKSVLSLKSKRLMEEMKYLQQKLKECSDEDEVILLQENWLELLKISNQISGQLDRVVTH